MATFAIIRGEKVFNVIEAETKEIAESLTNLEAVEVSNGVPWLNWTRDNNTWNAPVIVEEPTE